MNDFAERLIAWQRSHGRHDLPWQGGHDPYRIWLSEIMLQQTQVDTVIPYYARFLARFPDVASLAAAPVEDVMALWSGLGYYARARNLHRAARDIVDTHGGCFPGSAAEIAALPGIGRSTAAAIAAFAYGERAAILDGNVKRVLCRIFGVEGFPGDKAVENRLWALAESLLPASETGRYIQAQMDLGATLCTRGKPACGRCPFADDCVARRENRIGELPTPRPKKAVPRRSARYAVILRRDAVLLERRPPAGIWGGLLALPEIPAGIDDAGAWARTHFGLECAEASPLAPLTHTFTHFVLDMQPVLLRAGAASPPAAADDGALCWLPLPALGEAALPAPVRKILDVLAAPDLFAQ
ncbi:A/G-specific adenine glycosylase [Thauera linaloolentis]|uniref:Adenine DNA glycosylase n=1 Tax=Thauera linaloolentis (strain DSM 12138 / JCM 21573 / CCUG 41526 / CIP 105981 / IAM 15112 / NBRC 102519 / 47Lol) TaxID=1123367 RepID=N6Y3H5_THAL4|nr:A/G-specific adenine glycosylase [Thauera linaloolentis]ENO86135.1 A/G-specific adenine glycosylase [Thauera linaloolentis 47Lol = DSM 12138]MCM8564636.1 A/G-specific adenine glycosylase [Thauera linaloolentis]